MSMRTDIRDAGFSLAELMVGILIFVVSVVVLGSHVTTNYNSTQSQRDLVFAYTRAQAILSEVHSFVDRGEIEAAVDLDVLDDGVTNHPVLTVSSDASGNPLPADHPLSGNFQRDGAWVWSRRVSVRPFSGLNNRNVRYVTVRIFKRGIDGSESELASLSSVVNSVASSFPTTQVFDVYLLACANIPGWWVHMESIVPFVESAITDLENRNPGLSIRTHWITKSGYGRNPVYRPYLNDVNDSHATVDEVYYYPGKMPTGNASTYYYVPDLITARINVDGTERNGWDADTNPYPFALCDFYNHAMRYPRAKALHDLRVEAVRTRKAQIAAAIDAGVTPPAELDDMSEEPTLQLLLEGMCSDPDRYRNALLVNLHGELLPVPPLRNYSDPAKLPDVLPNVRAVTHPEELRTARPGTPGDNDVRLRVYAYRTDPDNPSGLQRMPQLNPIFVEVMDVDLTDGSGGLHPDVRIQKLDGGPAGMTYDTGFVDAAEEDFAGTAMEYLAWFNNPAGQRKSTTILLFHTPLVAPRVGDQGLYANERSRLYGLEYVPACTDLDATPDFSRHLGTDGGGPKNTARWRITIPGTLWDDEKFWHPTATISYDPRDTSEPDHTLVVRTRIVDLTNPLGWPLSGQWYAGAIGTPNQPENFSETYTWWADQADDVPATERCQFQGDPRHNPYKDLLAGDPDFGDGYNWFFDSLNNDGENARADYFGIQRGWNRWNNSMRQDVPRLLELVRTAITETRSIYTTLTGYSYYYVGVGNEIGYDGASGYPNSIPTNMQPWGGAAATTGFGNNITGSRCFVREGGAASDYWWGMPWLGELYPDSAYTTLWAARDADDNIRGNLAAGDAAGSFFRQPEYDAYQNSTFLAYGTRLYNSMQRTSTRGCVSLFNNGSSAQHFNHHFSSGTGYVVGPGVEIADNYGFPMPTAVEITRPFSLDTGGNVPPEFDVAPYTTERCSATVVRTFFNHPPTGHFGSGLVELENPAGTEAGYVVVNGIAQTTTIGTDFIGKFCLLSMFQSFFESGDSGMSYRIQQPARVEIMSPTEISELVDPTSIDIQFGCEWSRWDGQPYTESTPGSFSEDETELEYVVMYSPDGGRSWRYVQNDALATPGVRPTDGTVILADLGTGDETVPWSVPSGTFPEGSYLLRVECYRQGQSLHYSQHQTRIWIAR